MVEMKLVVLLFIGVCITNTFGFLIEDIDELAQKWLNFKLEHKKIYSSLAEERLRFKVFVSNIQEILKQDLLYITGKSSFRRSLNRFSDWTLDEVQTRFVGLSSIPNSSGNWTANTTIDARALSNLPAEVDWRNQNAVSPVKNQGSCGSCWAFSAAAAVESHLYLTTGQHTGLSEQQLVDCTFHTNSRYPNFGCNGGWMVDSYKFIFDNGGIGTSESYPYVARMGACRSSSSRVGARLSGHRLVKSTEDDLKYAVANIGPVSVIIYVGNPFYQYRSGVHYDANCKNKGSHAVLVVGYGTDQRSKMDYWLVKISGGADWGENGYIRMARILGNNCDIATWASYPVVRK